MYEEPNLTYRTHLTYQPQPDLPNKTWHTEPYLTYQTQPDQPFKPSLIYKEYFPTTRTR